MEQPTDPEEASGSMTPVATKKPEGKARYIWKFGILNWALPFYLLFMVMESFAMHRRHELTPSNLAQAALYALVLWLITGWVLGTIFWHRFRKNSKNSSDEGN